MDRFESMSVLVAVVEAGSLSAASRRLGMPLATVSRKISELEAHLKTRLLHRSTRRISLTESGRPYFEACKRILEDVGETERAALGEFQAPRGELVITAPIVFGRLHVLPVVTEFLKQHREIVVRLTLADQILNLLEHHVDLALRIGALPDSSLIALPLGTTRRVVCGAPSYFTAHGVPKHPTDLARLDCITFEGLTSPSVWQFARRKADVAVKIRSRLVVNTAEAAIDAAIAGIGLTRVLSYQIAETLRRGELAIVLEAFEPEPMPVSLVHAGGRLLPIKLRAFLDFAAPRLRARLRVL
jgi:DNA-binding transcriptional LysR family regulator